MIEAANEIQGTESEGGEWRPTSARASGRALCVSKDVVLSEPSSYQALFVRN